MNNQFHLDLEKYSLEKFRQDLESREMIPSRVMLKIDLSERFQILKNAGITNLKELTIALKTRDNIKSFSDKTGISIQYLTLLGREVRSYQPNPVKLDKIPGIMNKTLEKLSMAGIINSRQLFSRTDKLKSRKQLVRESGVDIQNLDELIGLSDLMRVYGIGPVFARLLYDAGVCSLHDLCKLSTRELIEIYEVQTGKRADFKEGEIAFTLVMARELAIDQD